MLWRALCNFNWDLYKSGQWKPLSGAIGATLFVISDTAIAVSAFRGRFLGSNYFIMSTYYGAQLALALTATKTRNPHKYRNN
uniref:lysoplasmalogenase n=1 Tax=Ciona savignyi TaxID=51511 RepID=H2ZJE7_CIOSA